MSPVQSAFIEFLRKDSEAYLTAQQALAKFDELHPKAWADLDMWQQRKDVAYKVETAAMAIADLVAHYFEQMEERTA